MHLNKGYLPSMQLKFYSQGIGQIFIIDSIHLVHLAPSELRLHVLFVQVNIPVGQVTFHSYLSDGHEGPDKSSAHYPGQQNVIGSTCITAALLGGRGGGGRGGSQAVPYCFI